MREPTDDFAALLAQAHQGDETALTELIRRYEYEVRLVARLKLGPALRRYLDSLDLAQSVHVALLRGLREEKFEVSGPEQLIGLAVKLVRWRLARHLRNLYRRPRISSLMAESGAVPRDLSGASRSDDPALAAELKDAVEQVLKDLDETDRRLVELRLQGYTTAEVAREIGVDADVLRVRLSRLRKRLADQGGWSDWL